MHKKILAVMVSATLLLGIYGCATLLAGAVGGAGTAVWLSGKLTQVVNVPFQQSVKAAKSALASLKLEIAKETIEKDTAQIMSEYSDGRTIWVDIHRVSDSSSKIEVRVGAVNSDKAAADRILKRIIRQINL